MLTIHSLVYGLSYIYWWWKPESRKDVRRPQRMITTDLQEPDYLTHNFRKQKIFSSHSKHSRFLFRRLTFLLHFSIKWWQAVRVNIHNSQFSVPISAQVGKHVIPHVASSVHSIDLFTGVNEAWEPLKCFISEKTKDNNQNSLEIWNKKYLKAMSETLVEGSGNDWTWFIWTAKELHYSTIWFENFQLLFPQKKNEDWSLSGFTPDWPDLCRRLDITVPRLDDGHKLVEAAGGRNTGPAVHSSRERVRFHSLFSISDV